MKKIYKTKLFTHIWLAAQYFILSVIVSMASASLILLIFKTVTAIIPFRTGVNILLIVVGVLFIIGGAIYNSGKKIVLENGILTYYNFFKEKYKVNIIKSEIHLKIKLKRMYKSSYLEKQLHFKENGIKKNIKCNWLSLKQCNDLEVAMEKYKYINFKNEESFNEEKDFERFFVGGNDMISSRVKKIRITGVIFTLGIFVTALIATFMIFERFHLYFFLITLICLTVGISIPIFTFLFFVKKRIEKHTPEYITVKDTGISADNTDFSKYDINKIEMTGREAEFQNLFGDRMMTIYNKDRKQTFVLGNFPSHLKKFLFSYESNVYKDYDLLYNSVMKWCFRNNIEFIRTGY